MISVVMATYNGEKYLYEQLDSIRNQTVAPDEVIICDDRSSDKTEEMFREYIEKYSLSNWVFSVNEKNLGYGNNFNQAVKRATGDFVFFSDQDDIWELDKIEDMIRVMSEHEDCSLLCTDYEPFYSEDGAPKAPKQILDKMPGDGSLEKITLSKRSIYIGALGCCMCAKKQFLDQIEKYWFDSWAQDDRMWRMAQCADGCYVYHKKLVKHRIHNNNASTYGKYHSIEKRVKLFEAMKAANLEMLSFLEASYASESQKKCIRKHIKMMEKRIALLSSRNLLMCFPLLGYLSLYERKKSFLVEAYMAIRSK